MVEALDKNVNPPISVEPVDAYQVAFLFHQGSEAITVSRLIPADVWDAGAKSWANWLLWKGNPQENYLFHTFLMKKINGSKT